MTLIQLQPDPKGKAPENPNLQFDVDIVAVHGLNPWSKSTQEHALDTWRAPAGDEGRLWLRDDLPTTLPTARIFLYEYDSTVVYGKDYRTFNDKANSLLSDIQVERGDENIKSRPLILLGHSLGGLLIEQSLVNAYNNPDEDYKAILKATTGLAFFATPHNGGREDLVALGAFASNIATFLGWKKGDNIIQTLKSGSLFTALLQDHWRHRLDQFNVVSFRGAEDDIVPGASATFGRSGDKERVVDLDGANHSTVCRFGDGDRDQYNLKKVKSNILYLYTKSKVKPLSEEDLRLLQLPPGPFLQVIRNRDDRAQMTIDQAGKQTADNMSSVMLAQTAIHTELALALGLGAGLSYAGSFLGPLVLTGVATLSTGALVLTYRHAVGQNNTQLNTSLPVVAQASTDMQTQLIEAHQRTILLNKYEELEEAQQKLKDEREEWQRARSEAEEAHEAMLHEILQRTVENSEQLASIRRNRAEASAVTSAGVGWLPSAVFKAAKVFVLYLARWIGAAPAH